MSERARYPQSSAPSVPLENTRARWQSLKKGQQIATASEARTSATGSRNCQKAKLSTLASAIASPKNCNARSRSISSMLRPIHPIMTPAVHVPRRDVQRCKQNGPRFSARPVGETVERARYFPAPSAIFFCHICGPVMWTELPSESTATVTGMSCTSNSWMASMPRSSKATTRAERMAFDTR